MQEGIEKVSTSLARLRFPHPAPRRVRPRILPVFTPRAGCRERCVFCAQESQSGQAVRSLNETLAALREALEAKSGGPPVELAFYGGTFTALAPGWLDRFLETAAVYRARGVVSAVRCSTRPDALDADILERLAAMGLDSVELGVQSFDDAVLAAAGRGHSGRDVLEACRLIRDAGMGLTLQLLPGLPGLTPAVFREDVAACVQAGPDAVRLHPCLVLAGTGLEALWREGRYEPWPLDVTVSELAFATLALWDAGIAVTRVGLAPEPSLEEAILAGPRHQALGTMVRARALLSHIEERLAGRKALRLDVPQCLSGEFWGHRGELEGAYARLGLARGAVAFTGDDHFTMDVTRHV